MPNINPQGRARIHRFHELVAISFSDTETLYLTPENAEAIGHELAAFAANVQCRGEKWFGTRIIRNGLAYSEGVGSTERTLV
ncbi:MAG: hypothetical protein GF334_13375 [Candidatus Altiarchaeales archaeon]|nr:hypothetical protein [Candidatus Altiarchaeales archaeon]